VPDLAVAASLEYLAASPLPTVSSVDLAVAASLYLAASPLPTVSSVDLAVAASLVLH
jgi:hypothetical protein